MPDYPKTIPANAFSGIKVPDRTKKNTNTLIVQRSVQSSTKQNERDKKYCGISALEIQSGAGTQACATAGAKVDAPVAPDSDQRVAIAPEAEEITIRWKFSNKEFIRAVAVELYRDVSGVAERIWTKNIAWKAGTCPETVETKFNGSLLRDFAPKSGEEDQVSKWGATKASSVSIEEDFNPADFPDGVLTIEHAPYLLRVVITKSIISRTPAARKMFVDVVAKIVRLRWGEPDMIPDTRVDAAIDPGRLVGARIEEVALLQDLRTQTQNPSADLNHVLGATNFDIVIPMPVFKSMSGQQPETDHTDFVETTKHWGNGPRLPVLAEVEIKKSDGTFVKAPKALGNAKFLWDWRDKDNVAANPKWEDWLDAGANQLDKDFLTGLLAEHHDPTDPLESDNCPVALGGKRGVNGDPVFPPQAGYDAAGILQQRVFPFEVRNSLTVRKWGVLSTGWRSGLLAGSTGVLFQPSRMAGDKYKLTVYCYYDPAAMDGPATSAALEANAGIACKSSGFLEVFRKVEVTCIKRGTIAPLPWNTITTLYKNEVGTVLQMQNDALDEQEYKTVLDVTISELHKNNFLVTSNKWLPLFLEFGLLLPQPLNSPAIAIKPKGQYEADVVQAFQTSKVYRLMLQPGSASAFKLEKVVDTNYANGIVVWNDDVDSLWVLSTNPTAFEKGQEVKGRASGAAAEILDVHLSCWDVEITAGNRTTKREVRVATPKGNVTFSFLPFQRKLDESTKKQLLRLLNLNAKDDPAKFDITVSGPSTGDDLARRTDVFNYVQGLFNLDTGSFVVKHELLNKVESTEKDNSKGPYNRFYYPAASHSPVIDALLDDLLPRYVQLHGAYAGRKGIFLFHMPGQDSSFNVRCTGGYFVSGSKRERGIVQVAIWQGMGFISNRANGSLINYKTDESVCSHELAHALFVAHALHKTNPNAPPSPKPHHHIIHSTCIMNYDGDSNHFCGFCVPRIRGWDWEPFKDVKFAITEVRLTNRDETKRSKSYMPALEGYNPSTLPGTDSFHFAPSRNAVQIRYKIFDPDSRIKSGTLTLKRVRDGQVLWSRPLAANERTHGDVSIAWNAKTTGARAFFAQDYLTVEHSPYRLEVNVVGDGFAAPPIGWTQFEVQVKMELVWGPRTVLALSPAQGTTAAQLGVVTGLERDHQVWEYLNDNELPAPYNYLPATGMNNLGASLPADGETKKVYLVQNLFGGFADQITNAQFGQQRAQWVGGAGAGDFGPKIPIFANIQVISISDNPVACRKALAGAKVLWDWEDATTPSDQLGYSQDLQDYLTSAEQYDANTTTPVGVGCHADRGGKRGLPGCVVFPAKANPGTNNPGPRVFPFEVSHAVLATRTWAAVSSINTAGPYASKTGVVFQPAHIAGDAYKLRAYLYFPNELALVDVTHQAGPNHPKEKIPKQRQAVTGRFEIWHEMHVARYYKKNHAMAGGVGVKADIDLTQVASFFVPAFIRLRFIPFEEMDGNTYNNALGQLVNAALQPMPPPNALPWFIAMAIDQPNNNWARGDYVFHYKTHAQYKAALEHRMHPNPVTNLAPAVNVDPIDPNTQEWHDNYYNEENYYKRMANLHYSRRMLIHLIEAYAGANPRDGIYLMQADGFSQYGDAFCNAASAIFLPHQPHRAPFFSVKYNLSGGSIEGTCAHEIGHMVFLNHIEPRDSNPWQFHSRGPTIGATAGGETCLMSYNFAQPRYLCGSCLLRLRGWSLYRVNPNGTTHEPVVRNPDDTGRTLGIQPAHNPATSPITITVPQYV